MQNPIAVGIVPTTMTAIPATIAAVITPTILTTKRIARIVKVLFFEVLALLILLIDSRNSSRLIIPVR